MGLNLNDAQIEIKLLERNDLFANAEIHFSEGFTIRGFLIQKSKQDSGNWVSPPSFKDRRGKWHPNFFMEDKDEWKKLETKILKEYEQKIGEEQIKVDDIDF